MLQREVRPPLVLPQPPERPFGGQTAQALAGLSSGPRRGRRGQQGRAAFYRRRRITVATAAICIPAFVAVGAIQLSGKVPSLVVKETAARVVSFGGDPPSLSWPSMGLSAVSVPSAGLSLQSGPESPVPIASLTKIMTAYLVLRDHPLTSKSSGPSVTVTQGDVEDVSSDESDDATYVPVNLGERLTERQLLNGLMIHSANNFADILAEFDAGSISAFVDKMNSAAGSLSMTNTHYVDPSGLLSGSVSTPADQLRLTTAAMNFPSFASVVDQKTVNLPLAGTLHNYVTLVGTDGVVGVKSGFTQAAMACMVLAADREIDGHSVLILAADTGQSGGEDPLSAAQDRALSLIDSVSRGLVVKSALTSGQKVATAKAPWSSSSLSLAASRGAAVVGWPGETARISYLPDTLSGGRPSGTSAGRVVVSLGTQRVSVPVVTEEPTTSPSFLWRFFHD